MKSAQSEQLARARLFTPLPLRNITLKNRLFRSATYEGMADAAGRPQPELGALYAKLAAGGCGAIITGFNYIDRAGRAMQRRQCGLDTIDRRDAWARLLAPLREGQPGTAIFAQLAHAGRQTRRAVTGCQVLGASARPCSYFRQAVQPMREPDIAAVIAAFGTAAKHARHAGFHGVQIHAGHGYLLHQFLSPATNVRSDRWADGPLLLEEVVRHVQACCGRDYPVLVKLSGAEDGAGDLSLDATVQTVRRLEALAVDAVEISYGTMRLPLNIIRGACPLDQVLEVNPLFAGIPTALRKLWKLGCAPFYMRRFLPFHPCYNLANAAVIKAATTLPVLVVGGIRSMANIAACLIDSKLDAVALCRPLICEPDWPLRLQQPVAPNSGCVNCNLCTVYCDSEQPLQCYRTSLTHYSPGR